MKKILPVVSIILLVFFSHIINIPKISAPENTIFNLYTAMKYSTVLYIHDLFVSDEIGPLQILTNQMPINKKTDWPGFDFSNSDILKDCVPLDRPISGKDELIQYYEKIFNNIKYINTTYDILSIDIAPCNHSAIIIVYAIHEINSLSHNLNDEHTYIRSQEMYHLVNVSSVWLIKSVSFINKTNS